MGFWLVFIFFGLPRLLEFNLGLLEFNLGLLQFNLILLELTLDF